MKTAINYFFEFLLFLVYFIFFRLPNTFALFKKIKSYKDWREIPDSSNEYIFPVALYLALGLWHFFTIWTALITLVCIFILSVIIGAIRTLIKNRRNGERI